MKHRVVVARPMPDLVTDRLSSEFEAVLADGSDIDAEVLIARAKDHRADALLVTSDLKLTAATIDKLPESVKIVATCSVGFDHLDVPAAKARGVVLTNTPDVVTECTADLTLLLILGASRRAAEFGRIMQQGWRRSFPWNEMLGRQVANKRLGIVGMGRIGRAVAKRARGFGMRILYTDPFRLAAELEGDAQYFPTMREMLPHSDILTLHLPGGPEADKMMNAEMFALLPRGAVFVNAARGRLVDEEALLEALSSDRLYAAGLDVFHNEPNYDLRFAELPNVFMTPHIGTSTLETRSAMGLRALDNVAAVCAGKPAIDPLW
jgi:lactate dehydrogenase-like 2-hydroxyacid dehydrogenase